MSRFIPVACPVLDGNERLYVQECLDTGWISSIGDFIPRFESAFAAACESRHAVAVNTGTAAIHLALAALGIGPGDEVIVPTLTFIATANAVRYVGATPVFADSEESMNLDPRSVAACITPRTRAIVVVHLYGHPADMDPIAALAREHGLFLVEDAAEAHGARYRGRRVGSLGDIAAFSFFGNKIMTTGEGGMVTTNSPELERQVRLLRGQGMDPARRYWFPQIGYNYRMTNIAAAIGLAQMERLEIRLEERRRLASWYCRHLEGLRDRIVLPVQASWASHAFWMYTIRLRESVPADRDTVIRRLAAQGIETRPVFYPVHTMPPYQQSGSSLPVAEAHSARGISLPTHGLLTEADVVRVADALEVACA